MIRSCVPDGGDVCTVIDEGVLNTDSGKALRRWILEQCELRAVVQLPEETFKPNKINVRSSVLLLKRRSSSDVDLELNYPIKFIHISSLGYAGSGEAIRGFDPEKLYLGIEQYMYEDGPSSGYHWSGFSVSSKDIQADATFRFDYKYWDPTTKSYIANLENLGHPTIKSLNLIDTKRGKSPAADSYVDSIDGYALVVKAGTNISKFGELIEDGDYIEKNVFEEMDSYALKDGDVLVSSTGTGTLGKSCVYRSKTPAVPDGHVTVIRVDQNQVYPEYLCDYLRIGFGSIQIMRLFTGSTGLIELTPEQLNRIFIEMPDTIKKQTEISKELRKVESKYRLALKNAENELSKARLRLFSLDPGLIVDNDQANIDEELGEDE